MRVGSPTARFVPAALLAFFLAPQAYGKPPVKNGGDYSQIQALADANALNKNGSDQSLQESTTNAMSALMKLANQNRSGAISDGYKAFGQYRNSGDLDGLRLKNSITALKMDTAGAYLISNKNNPFMAPISEYETSYRRLDPKFLKQGDAGKIAEQFEKATGMSRDTFLKKMASASDSDIKVTDPQLVDKVLTRFEGFVKEIPNAEFRDKVEKEIASVPQTVRTGLISQAVQKFTQMFAGSSVAPSHSDIAVVEKDKGRAIASSQNAKTDAAPAAAPATAPTPASSGDERAALTASVAGQNLIGRPEYRGIDFEKVGGDDAIGKVFQTALDEQGGEDTIFKQISRKYRSLTASLKQQAM